MQVVADGMAQIKRAVKGYLHLASLLKFARLVEIFPAFSLLMQRVMQVKYLLLILFQLLAKALGSSCKGLLFQVHELWRWDRLINLLWRWLMLLLCIVPSRLHVMLDGVQILLVKSSLPSFGYLIMFLYEALHQHCDLVVGRLLSVLGLDFWSHSHG